MSLNAASNFYFSWKDVFVIIIAMFYIDFAVVGLLLIKFTVIGIIAAIKRNKEFFLKYCHPFEVIVCVLLAHSILLFNIFQALTTRFQQEDDKSATLIGTNVQKTRVLEGNIDKLCDLLVLETLISGIFIVHYGLKLPITYKLTLPNSQKDERKNALEKRGFLSTAKNPYVFHVVFLYNQKNVTGNSTEENIPHKLSSDFKQEKSKDFLLETPDIKHQCEECNSRKKDIVILPCHHFEQCSWCLIRESIFATDHRCPTCSQVIQLYQAIEGVLIVEQIIGSHNLKVVHEFAPKQEIGSVPATNTK